MTLKQLIDKVMSDYEWYQQLKKDPAELSKLHGLNLNERQIDALRKINYESIDHLAEAFREEFT